MINDNKNLKALCLKLMRADTENEVICILEKAEFWHDDSSWRWLGDAEHNYSTVGNQQNHAEQAIVEKLVNSIDACIIREARLQEYLPPVENEPQKANTPNNVSEACKLFFGNSINELESLSKDITVAATAPGTRHSGFKRPCFSIADRGEGQTPSRMTSTILSLLSGNKDKIKFVQGKFNMGGTGVLEFCGLERNLQFVMSRRHPKLVDPNSNDQRDGHWGFTIIRRNDPVDGKGSQYVYLAPIANNEKTGAKGVLSFYSEKMPIFPQHNEPYKNNSEWGTIIKLYEYDAPGFRHNILNKSGLMARTRIMLPDPPLPVWFHECRPYRGIKGSSYQNMKSLIRTLIEENKGEKNDMVSWYGQDLFDVDGEKFTLRYFLFKNKDTADNYRKDEGLIFYYNGQTHTIKTRDFFRRKSVKMDYLWQSLLIFVDCSEISTRLHEQLFMNNRSQLRNNDFANRLIKRLEKEIGNHETLKELASKRRKQEVSESVESQDTIINALQNILEKNKTLASLLSQGTRVKNPHSPVDAGEGSVGFVGRDFPTKFHIKSHGADTPFIRDAPLGQIVNIIFETDANDNYFYRTNNPGKFVLEIEADEGPTLAQNVRRPRLKLGLARMTYELPDNLIVGDKLNLVAKIDDISRTEPFVNRITLDIKPETQTTSGTTGQINSSGKTKGDYKGGNGRGQGSSKDSTLDFPNPIQIERQDWEKYDPHFDKLTSARIIQRPSENEGKEEYDFYINVDNCYLTNFTKEKPSEAKEIRERFVVGMTLLTWSLIHHNQINVRKSNEDLSEEEFDVQSQVEKFTSAMAPFLIPMLDAMGNFQQSKEDEHLSDSAGENS